MQQVSSSELSRSDLPLPDLLRGASLFLDFDGTLVEIAEHPDLVRVDDALRSLLGALQVQLGGRLALVSGRSCADLAQRLETRAFVVAGSHGCEIAFPDGRSEHPPAPEALQELYASASLFGAGHPGVLIEAKPYGVAIHYRQAPQYEDASRAFAERLAANEAFTVQAGRKVFELKPIGVNKGAALRRLMQTEPMAGGRPVFIGDDLTDEAGFVAARELGGIGVLVGKPRETAASHKLPDVAAVRSWLAGAAA